MYFVQHCALRFPYCRFVTKQVFVRRRSAIEISLRLRILRSDIDWTKKVAREKKIL